MKIKIIAAVVGVLVALGAVGGTAVWAQQNIPNTTSAVVGTNGLPDANPDAGRGGPAHMRQVALEAAAKALGMTSDQLRAELTSGKSVADVAKTKNVDLKTLQSAIIAAEKAALDQAVKDGKITQAQADKMKAALDKHADQILERLSHATKNSQPQGAKHAALHTGLDAAAKALGMTADQLRAELKAGKSIADVAKAKNVDLQTVKNAVITAEKAAIDQALKDNKLTQAQADKAQAAVDQHADQLLQHMQQQHKPAPQQGKHK
ncbi:MAG: DUF2680 domain-containing protein [Chloroflexota bacterium]